ncbi:MAG: hypothetical protein LPK45_00050 [Bacteroidota bacterium]|nr:hypothetical protein [Bacteroidota bacterium]MDX5429412.1 hypothetical protein [Bacteroidota bacterium]MDX5468203.1 hypothetical protein [Bacteroidota bacterium]
MQGKVVHQDAWVKDAMEHLKHFNERNLDDALDHGFQRVKPAVAFGYLMIVGTALIWFLWWLKNWLKIEVFPDKDFQIIDDSEDQLP